MKTSHQTFILEMVKHGDKELAWQKANPGNKGGDSARKAADRLLRRHPEMAAEIEEAVASRHIPRPTGYIPNSRERPCSA